MDIILIEEIVIDIALGLLVAVGKLVYNRIRDRRRANLKSTMVIPNRIPADQIKDDGNVTVYKPDKAEIDADVQNAVNKLMPTVAERILSQVRGYGVAPNPWHTESSDQYNSYNGCSFDAGVTFDSGSFESVTPNSRLRPVSYEDAIEKPNYWKSFVQDICGDDQKLAHHILDAYDTVYEKPPLKVASYIHDVISKARHGSEIDREILA